MTARSGPGALWNIFIMLSGAHRLWSLGAAAMPIHASRIEAAFAAGAATRADRLETAYADLPVANFSRAVLAAAPALAVMPLPRSAGWSDWGTPRRVFESLRGSAEHDRLLARIARARPGAQREAAVA